MPISFSCANRSGLVSTRLPHLSRQRSARCARQSAPSWSSILSPPSSSPTPAGTAIKRLTYFSRFSPRSSLSCYPASPSRSSTVSVSSTCAPSRTGPSALAHGVGASRESQVSSESAVHPLNGLKASFQPGLGTRRRCDVDTQRFLLRRAGVSKRVQFHK